MFRFSWKTRCRFWSIPIDLCCEGMGLNYGPHGPYNTAVYKYPKRSWAGWVGQFRWVRPFLPTETGNGQRPPVKRDLRRFL